MGCLLGYIIAFRMVREFPIAGERLAEDRIEGFLDSTVRQISDSRHQCKTALTAV